MMILTKDSNNNVVDDDDDDNNYRDGNRANGEQKQNQASDLTEDETTQIPPAR